MPGGRPTKYTPDMCDRIIELGKVGASKHEMAMEIDVAVSTFDVWQNENKEFSEAVKKAVEFSQAWWEKQGRLATFGAFDGFNATSFIFNMKNRFRDSWRDKQETEHSGNTTTTIVVGSPNDKKLLDEV
jgi:transposase